MLKLTLPAVAIFGLFGIGSVFADEAIHPDEGIPPTPVSALHKQASERTSEAFSGPASVPWTRASYFNGTRATYASALGPAAEDTGCSGSTSCCCVGQYFHACTSPSACADYYFGTCGHSC